MKLAETAIEQLEQAMIDAYKQMGLADYECTCQFCGCGKAREVYKKSEQKFISAVNYRGLNYKNAEEQTI
jgi:hypothetical protein